MSGRYLLDTNIIISLFAGDINVLKKIEKLDEVFIPVIALGELYFGAQRSHHIEENLRRIDELVESSSVLECSIETAKYYGVIKKNLQDIGRPIPENDLWIAAIAREHNLTLISKDEHFTHIDLIDLEKL